jgi:hypothetical protein
MRILSLSLLAAASLAAFSLPAAAVPAGPTSGISSPPSIITHARMHRHHMRRGRMTWVQRRGGRR